MKTFRVNSNDLDVDLFQVKRGPVLWTRLEYVLGIRKGDTLILDDKPYEVMLTERGSWGDEFGPSDHVSILLKDK